MWMMVSQLKNYNECYETLELAPGAPFPEVRAAYERLKDLYGGDSIVMSPLEEELSGEWKERVLERIQSAYQKLSELHRNGGVAVSGAGRPEREGVRVDEALRARFDAIEEFSGEALRQVRKELHMEIHEVSLITKISKQHVKNIEEENFSTLPEEVFLRGYLSSCAKLYTLDVEKVINDYLVRYRAWKQGG